MLGRKQATELPSVRGTNEQTNKRGIRRFLTFSFAENQLQDVTWLWSGIVVK